MIESLLNLREHVKRLDHSLQWAIQWLEDSPGLEESLQRFLQDLRQPFTVHRLAFYQYRNEGLRAKWALDEDGKAWSIPQALDEQFRQEGEALVESSTCKEIEGFFCACLFYEEVKDSSIDREKLPLGMLAVEKKNWSSEGERLLLRYANFISIYLALQKSFEEMQQKAESLTQEVTSVRRTEWELKQKLKLKFYDKQIVGGKSAAMAQVFEVLERVIPSHSSVLLEGESGTGKDLIAHVIHYQGPLSNHPFVSVNCSALHAEVLESQIFGHVKGAFTGAVSDQKGYLDAAHGGTLFLDEIGELPLSIQPKLLRVLQQGEYQPLGSTAVRKADFRLIAASHQNLESLIEQGLFRMDLFYRLNVISIVIPPLRERVEDIPLLLEHFLAEFAGRFQKSRKKISVRALKALCEAPWPGNVRQLRNTLEMVLTFHSGSTIRLADLQAELGSQKKDTKPLALNKAKETFLKNYLEGILRQTSGRVPEAARLAGINRESLYRLMKIYLSRKDYRRG